MAEILSLVLSITALVTSITFALRQILVSRQSNMLPVLIDLYQEFRSDIFKQHLYYVVTTLRAEHDPNQTGFRFLPEPAATHVRATSHFFDNLGVLVASGAVDDRYVIAFTGDTVDSAWSALEPYIIRERELKKGDYQEFFEHLVVHVRENPPFLVRQRLKLRKLSDGLGAPNRAAITKH